MRRNRATRARVFIIIIYHSKGGLARLITRLPLRILRIFLKIFNFLFSENFIVLKKKKFDFNNYLFITSEVKSMFKII